MPVLLSGASIGGKNSLKHSTCGYRGNRVSVSVGKDGVSLELSWKEVAVAHMMWRMAACSLGGDHLGFLMNRSSAIDFINEMMTDEEAKAVRDKLTAIGESIPLDVRKELKLS